MLGFIDSQGRLQPEYYPPYYKFGIAGNCANFADTSIASHFNANWANPFKTAEAGLTAETATQKTAAPPPTAAVGGRPLALKTRQRSVGGLKVKRRFKFIFLDGNTSVASPSPSCFIQI